MAVVGRAEAVVSKLRRGCSTRREAAAKHDLLLNSLLLLGYTWDFAVLVLHYGVFDLFPHLANRLYLLSSLLVGYIFGSCLLYSRLWHFYSLLLFCVSCLLSSLEYVE